MISEAVRKHFRLDLTKYLKTSKLKTESLVFYKKCAYFII